MIKTNLHPLTKAQREALKALLRVPSNAPKNVIHNNLVLDLVWAFKGKGKRADSK